jgi:lipopolysaccharide transport system ATP-binding protein
VASASSNQISVHAEGVGKRYLLGQHAATRGLLVERLGDAIRAPIRSGDRHSPPRSDDTLWAVREMSFDLYRGEAVGLVGRNGAGKSTLLKLISRITRPTVGRVATWGKVSTLLEVGTGFHPELTGRENISLNGSILGMRRREIARRFDEIVEFSGVSRFLDTPVKRYSSGMSVRLAFAVAAHLDPEILLVDEVLAVGDGEFQRKCLGAMQEAAGEGRTVVFVSHNLNAVQRLCTRALLIEDGRIEMDGRPSTVVSTYLDRVGLERSSGVADIPTEAPRFGTGEARFRRATIADAKGRPINSVYLGQPLRVQLVIEVLEPVPAATFEVGISAMDGEKIVTAQSIDRERPPLSLEPGTYELSILVEVTLLPNEYTLDFGVHTLGGITMDWVERVLRFTALNEAESGGDHYRWPNVRGYVRPTSSWRLRPTLPEAADSHLPNVASRDASAAGLRPPELGHPWPPTSI